MNMLNIYIYTHAKYKYNHYKIAQLQQRHDRVADGLVGCFKFFQVSGSLNRIATKI